MAFAVECLTEFIPITNKFIDCLVSEAEAIHGAVKKIDIAQVKLAIEYLMNCKGRVVVTGVGKSGLIARKIGATLTSIGMPALYLHPSDALHGDLGLAAPGDVALILSYSGETEEVLAMLPYLRQRQIPIISIVGNLESNLARQSSAVLCSTVNKEACPLNLAPTTSTTVALAIGDALAVTLMHLKGVTLEAFAVNHPAGRLGKRLTLRVSDLMHTGTENPTVSPDTLWLDVVAAISQGGLGAVSVVAQNHLLGIITDGDVRRALQTFTPDTWQTLRAETLMTPQPITITQDCLAYDALQIMEQRPSQISVLPVIDAEQRCIGIIRLHDIVRSGLA
jgi:arabinose-5-phosphate isomerase